MPSQTWGSSGVQIRMTRMKWWSIVAVMAFMAAAPLSVRGATNEELAELGEEALDAGQFNRAVQIFEKLISQGATFEGIFAVKFDLAWAYYMVGRYPDALTLFESLSGDRAPTDAMRQQSRFMMAESLVRLAELEPEGSPGRAGKLDRAITVHTAFQTDNPRHDNLPESLYGRAAAYYLLGDLGRAAKDLNRIVGLYKMSAIVEEARFLLASVYARRGVAVLQQGDKAQAQQFLGEARKLFDTVIDEGGSRALAAGGMYSTAETWFKAGAHREAIRFFREIPSRDEVLRDLKVRIDKTREERSTQLARNQDTKVASLRLGRYQSEYRRVEESPDWAEASFFKIAESYFTLGRHDEVRAVCRHLLNFTQGEAKQQAWFLAISSYLEQGKPDDALREFTAFQAELGHDVPVAGTAGLAIGQLYIVEGRLEEALREIRKNLEEYPAGDGVEDATHLEVLALYYLGRFEAAATAAAAAREAYPDGKYVANHLYFQAMSRTSLEDWDGALAAIEQLLTTYPDGTPEYDTIDEAAFRKGWMLGQAGRFEESVTAFRDFLAQYPDSELRPEATYYHAVSLDGLGQQDASHEILRSLAAEYADHELAPVSLYQIAVSFYQQEAYPRMAEALETVIAAYPDDPVAADSWYWRGWIHRQDGQHDEAVEAYRQSIAVLPDGILAPEAMISIAGAYKEKAESMGLVTVLPEEKRVIYRESMMQAVDGYRELLSRFPDSDQALQTPEGIAEVLYGMVRARQMEREEVLAWYEEAGAGGSGGVAPIMDASLGSYLMREEGRQEEALAAFRQALAASGDARFPPALLSSYAEALKEAELWAEAETVYQRIVNDNPDDERALAPAYFGMGDIRYRQDDYEGAKSLFERVLNDYPWYEEGKEGRVKLAQILERNGQYLEAERMFTDVWKQEQGRARVGAMLGVSRTQLAQAEAAKQAGNSGDWKENVRVADENLTKIIVLYEAYPEYVAEALYYKGRAYEINGEPDKAKREAYDVLRERYPESPWAGRDR